MSWNDLRNTTLENDHVLLRPISAEDREAYCAISFHPDIWKYFVFRVRNDLELDQLINGALEDALAGRRFAFSIIAKPGNRVVGSMSYGNLAEKERRLEIGWSWLGKEFQGSGLNRWAKYLLLEHAFDVLGCERVEFKTDVLNRQACKGLENIGASREGVFRSYNYMPDNRRRDAVWYSIIRPEWPRIKSELQAKPKLRED